MEINGPPANIIKPTQLPSAISNWQVGQILQATVVRQTSPQTLILQIANQQLRADTTVSLPTGQKLELRVNQLGEKPILQARILGPTPLTTTPQSAAIAHPTTQPNQAVATDIAINNILKQALPKQAGMATLLANLAWLNQSASKSVPIPAAILDIAKQLFNQLPTRERLNNPGQLKQGILNSGIFLESRLNKLSSDTTAQTPKQAIKQLLQMPLNKTESSTASSATDKISADLKLGLLRLLGAVQQITKMESTAPPRAPLAQTSTQAGTQPLPYTAPPLHGNTPQAQPKAKANLAGLTNLPLLLLELGKQIESALSRTQLHQVASLPGNDQNPVNLAFELPVRNNEQVDIFDIVIREEDANKHQDEQDNQQQWSINLAFDLDGLGPVHAKLRMIDNKISTTFWAENMETTQLFNQNLENLRQRYHQVGLDSSELCCYSGSPPETSTSKLPHIVLDINV